MENERGGVVGGLSLQEVRLEPLPPMIRHGTGHPSEKQGSEKSRPRFHRKTKFSLPPL